MKEDDKMSRELHKKNDKYAIYSNVVDDYITPFLEKEIIKKICAYDLIEAAIEKAERYVSHAEAEID